LRASGTGNNTSGRGSSFIEAMLQVLSGNVGKQVAKRPFRLVFKAGNQAVHREVVATGDHLFERRRL
jgi:hypothetical protein